MNDHSAPEQQAVQAFIDRWQDSDGKELANYQLFLTELCQLLGLPGPETSANVMRAVRAIDFRQIRNRQGTRPYGL